MGDITRLVGRNIRAARRALGLSQWQLAERSGLSADFIGKVERGTTSPSIESLNHIAKALSLPLTDLFEGHPGADAPQGTLIELIQLCRARPSEDVALIVRVAQLIFQRMRDGSG
jgi:transcriptional regulator with XRE-family HTH domain